MLHAIMGLLDNSAHIDSQVPLGAYLYCQRLMLCARNRSKTRFLVHIYYGGSGVPRHSCTYTCACDDMHEHKTIMTVFIASVQLLPMQTLYEMSLMWDFSVVGLVNF